MEIWKEFTFEAAHRLPHVPPQHKCHRLHGHSFRCEVHVTGDLDPKLGWVIDYAEIARAFEPIHRVLDHSFLNEIEGLSNPTSEVLAQWIWRRLAPQLTGLSMVVIRETCNAGCAYRGE